MKPDPLSMFAQLTRKVIPSKWEDQKERERELSRQRRSKPEYKKKEAERRRTREHRSNETGA
jgi:hypothetical protein